MSAGSLPQRRGASTPQLAGVVSGKCNQENEGAMGTETKETVLQLARRIRAERGGTHADALLAARNKGDVLRPVEVRAWLWRAGWMGTSDMTELEREELFGLLQRYVRKEAVACAVAWAGGDTKAASRLEGELTAWEHGLLHLAGLKTFHERLQHDLEQLEGGGSRWGESQQ